MKIIARILISIHIIVSLLFYAALKSWFHDFYQSLITLMVFGAVAGLMLLWFEIWRH